ncbi:MAG: hypothetical protein J7L43_02625 [Candidatus Aenigmarchaeota archaeon]|nr:hypothetical protein [Candidatus Aenigmarchaeota archaeon]
MVYGQIANTILETILRIPPEMITGNFLKDITNLVILPAIVLIIFLDFVVKIFIRGHNKLKEVMIIALFLVIVANGWYGSFAAFTSSYIVLFLIFAGVLFFVSRFISRDSMKKLGGKSFLGKYGVIRDLNIERDAVLQSINEIDRELAVLNQKIASRTATEDEKQRVKTLTAERGKLIQRKIELEAEIHKMRRII